MAIRNRLRSGGCSHLAAPSGEMSRAERTAWSSCALLVTAAFLLTPMSAAAEADLSDLSLEDLMNLEVTSVAKKKQSKNDAASAITVITSEDLRRGGFTSVPEALRVVPGLQVARIDANRWAISARGFNQEFANKLLVMIDGRSVYTPLFGGVYWDIQDYPIEDIERIEVIRGPGGTIWGANAVNGVINVLTKKSSETQGTLVSGYGGTHELGGTARYGGKATETTDYRVFFKAFEHREYDVQQKFDGRDEWNSGRVGLRFDGTAGEKNEWRLSSDYYQVNQERGVFIGTGFATDNQESKGGNVLLNWKHDAGQHGEMTTQVYYDRTYRHATIEEDRHIADVDFHHDISWDFDHADHAQLSWGMHYRFSTSHTNGIPTQSISPDDEDFHQGGGFIQGQLDVLSQKVSLVGGVKLGANNWSGFEVQPSVRVLVKPTEGHAIWGAVSRAVRTPTQLDRNLVATIPVATPPFAINLVGNDQQRSEDLLSFEAGYRFFAAKKITAELSFFHNLYEDVSSLTGSYPNFQFANEGDVQTTGGELEINFLPVDGWRLALGYSVLEIEADVPTTPLSGTAVTNSSPQHQVVLRSFVDLPMDFELDTSLYWVDGLRDVVQNRVPTSRRNVEQYFRLDVRIGYRPTDWLELALVGQNLIDARHAEFNDVQSNLATEVPRSGYGRITLRF